MRPQLRALAAQNGGVFTRAEAVSVGYTERELKTRTGHGGAWVVVRRGCYAERTVWEASSDDGRYLLRVRAAVLSMRFGAAVSHGSAAIALSMPVRPRWRELVHVTRPGVTGCRTENGVKHHLAGFDGDDLTTASGMRVTGRARTAVDIGREYGYEDGVVAGDAALRLGSTHEDLDRSLARMTYWPGVTQARAAVHVADGGAQNPGESLLRLMVIELGIGKPETQFKIVDGGRWAEADVRVGRHLFEFDGRVKYVGREGGGVADKPAEEILWDEKRREDWLRRVHGGFGMSRVVWDEMFGPARRRTMRRLYDEYLQTLDRFGDEAA
ncbi:MAG TPA: type IV toxin-antitoxin system AbiEi family antitoxin domain-containing protein [Nocardioidaceae bacterium]|nr:type IV toxin-antitoxin system AbiEi family antitoxin domain-containing protein [Nocardioidaceae bacterium]